MENIYTGKEIFFDREKKFKVLEKLGSGGTGETILVIDEVVNSKFAIKKYSPMDKSKLEEYYDRFIDEIKILFNVSHPNIVRIYNHFLFPEHHIGYLQMEYVEGVPINKFEANENKNWDDVFIEIIYAFKYLEENKILHRDIRNDNILIDYKGNIKIIDFGFGKKLDKSNEGAESIILNWPVSDFPEEINKNGVYNHQSEMFFLAKLISKLIDDNFRFNNILEKMMNYNTNLRFHSFADIISAINSDEHNQYNFTTEDKKVYRDLFDILYCRVESISALFDFENDYTIVISRLRKVINDNIFEEYITDSKISELINCFGSGGHKIYPNEYNHLHEEYIYDRISVETLSRFLEFFEKANNKKRKIILSNIRAKLTPLILDITETYDEDLPF